MSDNSTEWIFFSNYAHVLVCLAENSYARLCDVAERAWGGDVDWMSLAFALSARLVGLPPLVGFLATGFPRRADPDQA